MPHLRPTAIRHHLRTSALLLALVPAAATLTSCGFDYPTDRVNTIGSGDNNRDNSVDALGIRVLATAKGEGRLIGALSNDLEERATLDSVESPEGQIEVADFEPVAVEGGAGVNLTAEAPISLTGDFTAGDVVPLRHFGQQRREVVSEEPGVDARVVHLVLDAVPTRPAPSAPGDVVEGP